MPAWSLTRFDVMIVTLDVAGIPPAAADPRGSRFRRLTTTQSVRVPVEEASGGRPVVSGDVASPITSAALGDPGRRGVLSSGLAW